MRLLILSHAHPALATGGAQLMAYQLHTELVKACGVDSHFLAWAPPGKTRLATFSSQSRDGREILFHGGVLHPMLFSQEGNWLVTHDFRELLDRIQPDVVHFQHFAGVGVDMMREVRNWSKRVPMILTLHEYLAICHNGGKMVKTADSELCYRSDPRACSGCFPTILPEDFFLRKLFLKSHFDLMDQFVAPSHFLKARYVDWGLDDSKIEVMENGQPAPMSSQRRRSDGSVHFAFVGKVFRIKGIFVLLDAIELLSPEVRQRCEFSIYGNGIEEEPYGVRSSYEARLNALRDTVRAYGRYRAEEVGRILSDVDWTIFPSTWWENSPLVIQESFACGVPVICSDIGGMAEKVRDGIDGLHFRMNDPRDLARAITTAVMTKGLRDKLCGGITAPPTVSDTAKWHLGLYERLLAQRSTSTGRPAVRAAARD
jgi:glycosyltransferase involved in cell wall biosynthesis